MVLAEQQRKLPAPARPQPNLLSKRWFWPLATILGLIYIISPLDIIPEAIAGPLGYIEDILLAIGWIVFTLIKAKGYLKLIAISSVVIAAALCTVAVAGIILLVRSF